MTDKPIMINGVDVAGCEYLGLYKECKLKCGSCYPIDCSDNPNCYYKQLKRKEQECQQAMDNYVQLDLQRVKEYNELVDLYKAKEQECEELRRSITKIFTCLIKANNRGKIVDTIWVDRITTLWDYIALTLGIEGDQTQIEEQILQKISEYKGEYNEKIR